MGFRCCGYSPTPTTVANPRPLLPEQMCGAVGLLGQAVLSRPHIAYTRLTQLLGVHAVPPGNRSVSRF